MAPVHAFGGAFPNSLSRPAMAAALLAAALFLATAVPSSAQEAPRPGEAFLTRFSGTVESGGQTVIDPDGVVASLIDLSAPGAPPNGAVLQSVPQRLGVTAAEIGQVFGLAIDDGAPPRAFLSATPAFGLHLEPGTSDWMPGMWGEGGGPGTIYILDPERNYAPQIFADVTLDGRPNSGAGLGNIVFDPRHRQLFVSDLETGMIHRLDAESGDDLGRYDHGVNGRASFRDAASGAVQSLAPVPFDPTTTARLADCPTGDFARSPSCWNFADFRRRVWGIAVRDDPLTHQVRLFYALWSGQGFGHPDFAGAPETERKNSVWSVGIAPDGSFDTTDVRREFVLPDFFRSPEAIARAGFSNPVADIAFGGPDREVMLLAERGGVRNLGLGAEEAFSFPHEARVLRYQYSPEGHWEAVGRYDVGYYDRKDQGPPYLRAGASGGVSFGPGFAPDGTVNPAWPDAFAWFGGDALCSPLAPCFDPATGDYTDAAEVNGAQGLSELAYGALEPDGAFSPYPATGPATPPGGPDQAYFIDADPAGAPPANDATRIGDIEVYQPTADGAFVAGGPFPPPFPPGPPPFPPEPGWDPAPLPPGGWFPLPPLPYPTDLAITKTGPASCQEGVDCLYAVKITNLGAVPYVGILAVNDTMPAGATLSTASPGWNCVEAAPAVSCRTNAFAILNVGGSATLNLAIRLPAAVPGPTVENCAAIDWFEMGTDDGPGDANDVACVTTPVDDGFDLGLTKSGPANCVENANCLYGLAIKNWGPGDFAGTLAVKDTLPANVDFVSATAGWSCIQAGTDLTCEKGGMTLLSGAFTLFSLTVKLPDGIAGGSIENCAEINWAAMTSDDGAADAHADDDCHTTNINPKAGFFDLGIAKVGPANCDPGGNCDYTLEVTNHGPDDYAGTIGVRDVMPAGASFVSADAAWGCAAAPPVVNCFLLGGAVNLMPGESRTLDLTIQLPNPFAVPSFLNCGVIRFGQVGMPVADNPAPPAAEKTDVKCTITHVGDGADLVVEKLGPEECYEGHECEYTVRVTNAGPKNYFGTAAVTDTLPAGASVVSASDGWNCHEFAAGTTTCAKTISPWAPGVVESFQLTVLLPDPVAGLDVENCAEIDWTNAFPGGPEPSYTGDDDATNDGPVCVTTPVLAADLAPFGGTICERGADCNLDVEIENRGGKLFRGSAGLRGTFLPALQVRSVAAETRGLQCSPTNDGYECAAEELEIEAGESARIKVVVFIPEDFPEDRVMHRKEMIWPDAGVKDEREENDRHVSFITIAEEQDELQCSDGRVVNGECTCPGGIEPQQVGPNAYRCVPPDSPQPTPPPRPVPQCEGGRVQGGACVCPQGFDRQQIGPNAYRCLPPPQLICEGGRVSRGDCLCPEGFRRQQTGSNAFRCIAPPPPPQLVCEGGRVSRGECACPEGFRRQQTGPNAFRCIAPPPPPQLVCEGGRVSRGECACPEGFRRQQIGPNAFRCVAPPPPQLVCEGGRVANSQCFCPSGTVRLQTGPNAYRCQRIVIEPRPTPTPTPTPTCQGGRIANGQCFCPTGTIRRQTGPNAFSCVRVNIQIPQLPNLRLIPPPQTAPQ